MNKVLNWGMTPGMGDAMMALNCAHHWSKEFDSKLQLNFHWFHDENYLHHCEETETIIERTDYIHGLYLKSNVEVNHIINSDQFQYKELENRFDWFKPRKNSTTNSWCFDPSISLPIDKRKVVIWRPLNNVEIPRYWKRTTDNNQWNLIIYKLKEMGYNVIELCYRTPIREATYHINTCDFVVCYDGMWHYIAKNFWKPMIVTSDDAITNYHTRHCVKWSGEEFTNMVSNIHEPVYNDNREEYTTPYEWAHRKALKYEKHFWKWYNGN